MRPHARAQAGRGGREAICRRSPRSLPFVVSLLALASAAALRATEAHAALTDSEKGQVRGYVASGDLGMVSKLRALVARPDLSDAEAADVMASALRATRFDDRGERFVHALLFGPASLASRSVVAPAVVRGLLARADTVMAGQPGNPNQWSLDARDELLRIHRYIARMTSEARDSERQGMASLETRAVESIASAYRGHLTRHAPLFAFKSRAEGAAQLLRLQVARAAVQTASVVQSREDLADSLGMGSTARGLFVRTGVMIDDGGAGPEVRLAEIASLLEAVPNALDGVSVVLVAKAPSDAPWGHELLAIRTPLGALAPKRAGLWPDSTTASDPDQALFEAAFAASLRSARQQLASQAGLSEQVGAAMSRAAGKGSFGHLAGWVVDSSLDRDAASSARPVDPDVYLAATMTMLMLDAGRTSEQAALRLLAGRSEPAEQLALAWRALAVRAAGAAASAQVGRMTGADWQLQHAAVVLDGDRVTSVSMAGRTIGFEYGADGRVTSMRRDGKPIRSSDLALVRVPTAGGDRWQAGARDFVRLNGEPRVGVLGQDELVLEAAPEGGTGNDAIYTEAPGADQVVEARLQLGGGREAGQLVRAATGTGSFQGVVLVLRCTDSCFAKLVSVDGAGHERELASEMKVSDGQPSDGLLVRLSIRGQEVTAKVAGKQLRARVVQPVAPGHVGWMVRPGSRLMVRNWLIERAK